MISMKLILILLFFSGLTLAKTPERTPVQKKLSLQEKWQQLGTSEKWLQQGSLADQSFKKTQFQLLLKKQKPNVVFSRFSVSVEKEKGKWDILFFSRTDKKGLTLFLNGREIRREKGESLRHWFNRNFGQTKKVFFRDLIFPKAFAQNRDQSPLDIRKGESPWSALIATMAFENFIYKTWDLDKDQDARLFMDSAQFLVDNQGLQCNRESAHFRWSFPSHNKTYEIRTKQTRNSDRVSIDLMVNKTVHNIDGEFLRMTMGVYTQERNWGVENSLNIYTIRDGGRLEGQNFQTSYALEYLSQAFQKSEQNPQPKARPWDLKPHIDALLHWSDIARACCSNMQCREYTKVRIGDRPASEVESTP